MKIRSHQSGGIVYLPTSNQTQGAVQQTASSSETTSKVPGFAKELIDIIKENGLPSDVDSFLQSAQMILNSAADPTGQNLSMKEIYRLQGLANRVKMGKESYDAALKSIEEQNAWGEAATDTRGNIYVQDKKGNLELISTEKYIKNKDEYMVLTNDDVLSIRRDNSQFAYQSNMLDHIVASVGMTTITEYAKKLIEAFGTTKMTGYTEKQKANIKSGLQKIVSGEAGNLESLLAAGTDGMYKISQESTVADTNITEALKYLYNSMPNTYKNTLRAKAAVENMDPSAYLLGMMYINTDRTITADFDATASKAAGYNTDKGSTESLTQDNIGLRFSTGQGMKRTTAYISPKAQLKSDKSQLAFDAWNGGYPLSKSGNRLGTNNMKDLIPEIEQFAGVDLSTAFFGNQKVTANDLGYMVWDGESKVTRVALPKKIVNGQIVPDFDLCQRINELTAWVADHPGTPKIEIVKRMQELGVNGVTYDEKTNSFTYDQDLIGLFGTVAVYANDDLIEINEQSEPYVEHLSRQDGKLIKDEYNNYVMYGKANPNKNDEARTDKKAGNGDFVYGNLYFAITDELQSFNMTENQYIPKSTFTNVSQKYQLGEMLRAGSELSNWQKNFKYE